MLRPRAQSILVNVSLCQRRLTFSFTNRGYKRLASAKREALQVRVPNTKLIPIFDKRLCKCGLMYKIYQKNKFGPEKKNEGPKFQSKWPLTCLAYFKPCLKFDACSKYLHFCKLFWLLATFPLRKSIQRIFCSQHYKSFYESVYPLPSC